VLQPTPDGSLGEIEEEQERASTGHDRCSLPNAVTALALAPLHCAAFGGSVALRGKRRAGCQRAVLPGFVERLAPTGHARLLPRGCVRRLSPAHEAGQQARSVCEA